VPRRTCFPTRRVLFTQGYASAFDKPLFLMAGAAVTTMLDFGLAGGELRAGALSSNTAALESKW
jgi:hypothetical protein